MIKFYCVQRYKKIAEYTLIFLKYSAKKIYQTPYECNLSSIDRTDSFACADEFAYRIDRKCNQRNACDEYNGSIDVSQTCAKHHDARRHQKDRYDIKIKWEVDCFVPRSKIDNLIYTNDYE